MRLLACSLMVVVLATAGCDRDLGDCNLDGTMPDGAEVDGPAAFDVAYRVTDGLPMYEGQALVQSTCGDSTFCHSPAAVGADRFGAPAGLNFDVSLVCTEDLSGCQSDPPYGDRIDRFNGNQGKIRDWAEGIIQEVRAGAMPPGEAGRRVANTTPWVRPDGSALPSIHSGDGREILRNWLACGSPAIGRTEPAPTETDQLQLCGSSDEEVICVYSGPADLPDPTWTDIYWKVIFTQCVSCHGPANDNVDQNPDNLGGDIPGGASAQALTVLDLSGTDLENTTNWAEDTYDRVVDVSTSTSTAALCAGQGLIIDSTDGEASIMVQKMRGTQPCGGPMPANLLPAPLVDVVSEWADLGAPLN